MWTGAYPEFNIALVVNIPLENNVARGLKQIASQEQDQAEIQRAGPRSAHRKRGAQCAADLSIGAFAPLHASRARFAAEAVYASEVRKFHNGESTTFLVLQRQVELAQARGQELQAQSDLNKAVVELQRVEGTILTDNGVNVQTLGSKALASARP